jgi:hypothetical protein
LRDEGVNPYYIPMITPQEYEILSERLEKKHLHSKKGKKSMKVLYLTSPERSSQKMDTIFLPIRQTQQGWRKS